MESTLCVLCIRAVFSITFKVVEQNNPAMLYKSITCKIWPVSRYMIVYRVPCVVWSRKQGVYNIVSILTGQSRGFHPYIAPWCLSWIAPNLQCSCSPYQEMPYFKFKRNPFSHSPGMSEQNFIKCSSFFFFFALYK